MCTLREGREQPAFFSHQKSKADIARGAAGRGNLVWHGSELPAETGRNVVSADVEVMNEKK